MVEADLLSLAEHRSAADVDVDLQLVLDAELRGQRFHCRPEALIAQHDRLDVEGQIAELLDRLAVAEQGRDHDFLRVGAAPVVHRMDGGIEHQCDPGQVLDGAVVEEEGEPASLVLLGGDDPVGEPTALLLTDRRLGQQPGVLELDVLVAAALADDQPGGHDDSDC